MAVSNVDLGFRPYKHQLDAYRKCKRFSVLVWHRRAGKSVFAIMRLIYAALETKRPDGRYAYIGPKLNQTKRIAWDYLCKYLRQVKGVTFNNVNLTADLPNGSRISVYGVSDPETVRGLYLDGVVMDEVADMNPETWATIVRPALADRQGWALFIGTPKGHNLFSEMYYSALNDPSWYADMRRWEDTGVLPVEEIDDIKAHIDETEFRQEFECDFGAALVNGVVSLEDVLASQRRSITRDEFYYAPKILGVDVARYGSDRSVVIMRQGPLCYEPKCFRHLDTMEFSAQVAQIAAQEHPSAIFVDNGAMGPGVVDRLRQLGLSPMEINFNSRPISPRYENKRAEMWILMRDWIKSGGCLPPGCEDLAQELTTLTYTYANKRGRLQLESKDDLKKRGMPSPDIADALALTFALPVKAPLRVQDISVIETVGSTHAVTDYDPFA